MRPRVGRFGPLSLVLSLAGLLGLAGCAAPTPPVPIEPEPELDLRPTTYDRLRGWSEDDPSEALIAFARSCAKLRTGGSGPMGPEPVFGAVADWLAVCAAADEEASAPSTDSARQFFETWFQPYQVFDKDEPEGLFTGYYEPVLHGSRRAGARYPVPLRAPPSDLLRIDLGRFNPELAGYAIVGRIGDG